MAGKSPKKTASKTSAPEQGASSAHVPGTVPVRDRIIDAALSLARVQSWGHCGVRDIAQEAGVDLAEFYEYFDDRNDVLQAYGRRLDRQVLETFSEPDYEASPRDRLFDILMERFDLASGDRDAIRSVISSARTDPKQCAIGLPHLCGSMTKMLEAAGLDTTGLRGAIRVAAVSVGILWVMKTWVDDETEDQSKTMAALDKFLGNLEKAADRFGF